MIRLQNAEYEERRIGELKKYNILDTLTEKDYEDITYLASVICNVPIALISFVDEDRQWFKSHQGLTIRETSREYSFCAHALNKLDEIMIVPDSRTDQRFKNNPLVIGEPNIVFYAGFPLVSRQGFGLGTVCVIDTKTHVLNESQVKALQVLATQVMNLLELRKANHELQLLKHQLETHNKNLEQFAMVVAHDIKSPLATVLSANQMLESLYNDCADDNTGKLVAASISSAKKIKSLVDGILSNYQGGDNDKSRYEPINLHYFFEAMKQTISSPKKYILTFHLANDTIVFNRTQLEQVFYNLITNSLRYNNKAVAEILISSSETASHYQFRISDNGIGIAPEHHDTIFDLYATVSTVDSFGLRGSGIGLPTVKKIVEQAGGNITIASEPGKSTTFTFTLLKEQE